MAGALRRASTLCLPPPEARSYLPASTGCLPYAQPGSGERVELLIQPLRVHGSGISTPRMTTDATSFRFRNSSNMMFLWQAVEFSCSVHPPAAFAESIPLVVPSFLHGECEGEEAVLFRSILLRHEPRCPVLPDHGLLGGVLEREGERRDADRVKRGVHVVQVEANPRFSAPEAYAPPPTPHVEHDGRRSSSLKAPAPLSDAQFFVVARPFRGLRPPRNQLCARRFPFRGSF